MSDINSIWPNGMQVDSEGYAVFYPMGTNKVEIPKNSPHWPKGNKLIGQFVYKDDKLVGFCDTKAMTSENEGIVVMPYEYIDTEFDSIPSGNIQIHAPKAVVKKASWTGGEKEDIPDVEYKYKGCKNVNEIKIVDANYLENDIVNGKWTELLSDLINSSHVFSENEYITSFTSDLSSLTNGDYMFYNCKNLTLFDSNLSSLSNQTQMFHECEKLISFISNLSSLTDGNSMFWKCSSLTTFNTDLKSLINGYYMFVECTNLTTFTSDLSSLTNGDHMFAGSSNLTTFNCSKLNFLTNGNHMFSNCPKLSTFDYNLDSLLSGKHMFYGCKNISSFNSKLDNLENGHSMFFGCSNLTSFNSSLKSLIDATAIFSYCSNLTSFKSDLNSLINGNEMFHYCRLDAPSIKNIIATINTVESSNLTLGMGCNNNQSDKDLFAQEVGYTDMTTLLAALQNKGWTVTAQFNGRPSSNYSLRQPEPLPVYVKLVEIVPTEEDSFYEYTSIDGSKLYNLDWFHETTGSTDGYETFQSLEEAISHFNIKPIEK